MAEMQTDTKKGTGPVAPPNLADALKRVEQLEAELSAKTRERDTALRERDSARTESHQFARRLTDTERRLAETQAELAERTDRVAQLTQEYKDLRAQEPKKALLYGLLGIGVREFIRKL